MSNQVKTREHSYDFFSEPGHFKNYGDRTSVFLHQLRYEISKLPGTATILDVGCGDGIALSKDPQYEIAKQCGTYWGIEPDSTVEVADCFHRVWNSTLEEADIPDNSVDFAYSQMVLEHVLEPEVFLEKISRILKPGGTFLSLTVNADSTFATIASVCYRLRVQDLVLKIAVGKTAVEEYHYPAVYKMTAPATLRRLANKFGFTELKMTLLEADEWLFYFPTGTKWLGRALTRLLQRKVSRYTWMLVRFEK